MKGKRREKTVGTKKSRGRIELYKGRLSVLRGVRLSGKNVHSFNQCPLEKSQALYEALTDFFRSSIVSGACKVTKSRKIIIVQDDYLIPKIDLGRDDSMLTSLWVELELDAKVKDLKMLGYSMQQVFNYALQQYFLKRER